MGVTAKMRGSDIQQKKSTERMLRGSLMKGSRCGCRGRATDQTFEFRGTLIFAQADVKFCYAEILRIHPEVGKIN